MSEQNQQRNQGQQQQRNQGGQRNQGRPQQRKEYVPAKLTETLVDIDPVGVVYTVDSDTISRFVTDYLGSKGISDSGPVIVDVRENRNSGVREASLVLFFRQGSRSIEEQRNRMPRHIRNRMSAAGLNASDDLKRALHPMLSGKNRERPHVQAAKGLYAIELDIFHVIAMMLAVDPDVHDISITEVAAHKKQVSMTVFKTKRFINRVNSGDLDQYEAALRAMRRN